MLSRNLILSIKLLKTVLELKEISSAQFLFSSFFALIFFEYAIELLVAKYRRKEGNPKLVHSFMTERINILYQSKTL